MNQRHQLATTAGLTAALEAVKPRGFNSGGVVAATPERTIRHRVASLKRGIGAPSHGAPAEPNPERTQMRQEASVLGMTGKQYRKYLKHVRREARVQKP